MVKKSDVQKKSRGRGEDLQNEYIRELKLLRSMAHEVCDNFTLRREGNIETIISCLATVPRKKLREMLPEWLREIRSLKLKPQKGRLKDLKEIDRVITGLQEKVMDTQEKKGRKTRKRSKPAAEKAPATEGEKLIK
jgi:hypothetical protein